MNPDPNANPNPDPNPNPNPNPNSKARGVGTLAELPWLLEDAITGEREPPNPTVGPRLTIVRAAVAPPSIAGAYKRYVAVSVSRDGGYD